MTNLIQWPSAKYWTYSWNPIVGCKKCSPACDHCYAAAWADRYRYSFEPHGTTKHQVPRNGVVFCGNMTDLFGDWNASPAKHILATLQPNAARYLWCTKRVPRMLAAVAETFINADWKAALRDHHYFGITAENQEWFEKRIEQCIDHPYGINMWLSLEPLLSPIDLYPIIQKATTWPFEWVVVGCESGPDRRPCKLEWVEAIVYQCRAANIPVFVKQLDIDGKCERDITKFPKHLQIRQVPWMRVHKLKHNVTKEEAYND